MKLDRQQLRARVAPERPWYRITNLSDGAAEIVIYDEIGYWGTSAESFLDELRGITAAEITVRINSPGGEVFDGIAIMNVLRSHPARVTVHVDGIAASIASVIAMAGDRIIMQPHSQMMIHDGSGFCYGQASDMRVLADLLDKLSNNIASVYAERAGGTVEEWRARMLAETWYDPQEAVDAGLADEVATIARRPQPDDPAPAAAWDLSVFRFAGRTAAPAPEFAREDNAEPEPVEPEPVEPVAPEPEPVAEPAPEAVDVAHEQALAEDAAHAPGQAEPAAQAEPDEWAELAAHLITPPSAADEWERLREALL